MSKYYQGKRNSNIFDPNLKDAFKLSRSKIDGFLKCPRCFYLDRRLGVGQPPSFPFNLNSAVDELLKKEFDIHRDKQSPHPLMQANNIEAIPFPHAQLNQWRDSLKGGIGCLHKPTNLWVYGGIDDVWINNDGELIIVDYKATSKTGEVSLDAPWQIAYKRQMEVYQWLFRQNGFKVSDTGYFVYCNGKRNAKTFDAKLEFDIKVIPYTGNDNWVEKVLGDIKACLMSDKLPDPDPDCDYCKYRYSINQVIKKYKKEVLS